MYKKLVWMSEYIEENEEPEKERKAKAEKSRKGRSNPVSAFSEVKQDSC